MSGLDGIELVEEGLKASPRLRVILMSGFVGELNRAEQQLKGKVACVIAKPFTLDYMRNTVKGVLGWLVGADRCSVQFYSNHASQRSTAS